MTHTILSVQHIFKRYRMGESEFTALSDVTLTIREGEYVAIIGPSGSGKSTLMHLIDCLDRPTKGSITVEGVDISKASDANLAMIRNTKIGFVFQQFNLLRKTTALSNVELPLVYSGSSPTERLKRATKILSDVGLADKLKNHPSQLSGGQQQRVAIARALVTNPKLLLADEPTGNLDSKSGEEILVLLDKLHADGHTIVVVTHDPSIAKRAKRTISLKDGKILKDQKS